MWTKLDPSTSKFGKCLKFKTRRARTGNKLRELVNASCKLDWLRNKQCHDIIRENMNSLDRINAQKILWSRFSAKKPQLGNWRMRVAIIVTFERQKPSANRGTLRQDRSYVPVGIRCWAVVGPTSTRLEACSTSATPIYCWRHLNQYRVAVSYKKAHVHVEDGDLVTRT